MSPLSPWGSDQYVRTGHPAPSTDFAGTPRDIWRQTFSCSVCFILIHPPLPRLSSRHKGLSAPILFLPRFIVQTGQFIRRTTKTRYSSVRFFASAEENPKNEDLSNHGPAQARFELRLCILGVHPQIPRPSWWSNEIREAAIVSDARKLFVTMNSQSQISFLVSYRLSLYK